MGGPADASDRSSGPQRAMSDLMNSSKGLSAATASLALGLTLISMSGPTGHAQSLYSPDGAGIPGKKGYHLGPAPLTPVPSSAA